MISQTMPEDSRDLWAWRNDALARAMALVSDKVTWESHQAWFNDWRAREKRRLYIGRLGDLKIGLCHFDVGEGKAEVSINLNPGQRGQGLSSRLLAAAMEVFLHENYMELHATIKKPNAACIKCFSKCGFVFHRADEIYNYYKYSAC